MAKKIIKLLKGTGRVLFSVMPFLRPLIHPYWRNLYFIRRTLFYVHDAVNTHRFMRWEGSYDNYWKLSSELLFQYHKLEKGLCIPGQKRFFGESPAFATLDLITRWRNSKYPVDDPIYLGAMETLAAYKERLMTTPPPKEIAESLNSKLEKSLSGYVKTEKLKTPMPNCGVPAESSDILKQIFLSRRSVRAFSSRPVDIEDLMNALSLAQLSPSACNRQPWKVHIYQERKQIDYLLELQNGNSGFGFLIPMLLIICVESNGFFDGIERNQPYIDSGLFSMSLLLSLQSKGLSTCCLNWCVTPEIDKEGHRRGEIPDSERIVMYLAVGYADNQAIVPRSARRKMDSLITMHS